MSTEQKHRNDIVIAVDFDGTCVYHNYPEIGEDVPGCVAVLKKWQLYGIKIILHTMRGDSETRAHLSEAVQWFRDRGIELHGINVNPTQKFWTNSPKAYAHCYVDDAGVGTPLEFDAAVSSRAFVHWPAVEDLVYRYVIGPMARK